MRYQHKLRSGFTIVEILVVVVVLSALITVTIAWVNPALIKTTKSARDSERRADMQAVANIYEDYYRTQPTAVGASYPTTSQATGLVDNEELLTPPTLDTTVFNIATSAGAQDPTVDEYIYQPLNTFNQLCTTEPCVRFVLYYRTEVENEVKTIESERQQ